MTVPNVESLSKRCQEELQFIISLFFAIRNEIATAETIIFTNNCSLWTLGMYGVYNHYFPCSHNVLSQNLEDMDNYLKRLLRIEKDPLVYASAFRLQLRDRVSVHIIFSLKPILEVQSYLINDWQQKL